MWTTPKDWAYKEAPGSNKMNEQVRDNLNYLKASVPAGVMFDYGGATAPAQYLLCDGSAISRATYSELFTAIGVAYGAGDNSTTFNVPDSRGRTTVGAGQGAGLTNRILATIFGTETHALSIAELAAHNHGGATGGQSATHTHLQSWAASNNSGTGGGGPDSGNDSTGAASNDHTHTISSQGSGTAHPNTQPSLVVTKIIKY